MMMSDDFIRIEELELSARIGVTDEERRAPQRLVLTLTLWPQDALRDLQDDIEKTIDYAHVCEAVKSCVAGRTDRLIETLAEAVASVVLSEFSVARVRVEVRKFVLPDVRHVSVTLTRARG